MQAPPVTDAVDGTITPTSSGTVDASQAGTYTLTYSCRDAAGNDATPVEREVIVSAAVINTGQNPPTFVSSTLNNVTGVLAVTFSEDIDATPAANVVPAKIHVRESGSYTGGVTLSAGELATAVDGTVISFTLTAQHLAAVKELNVPELTIEPGAVKDTSGDLIVGTFDVSTAVFADSAFSVSPQDPNPRGMAFSSDGTKMFVAGFVSSSVYEYTLSAPFDISAPVIVGDFSVSAQDSSPTDVALSNDGTKMFVVGYFNEKINEYTLTTDFSVSSATFANDTSVSQDYYPEGMALSNDGTKMFMVGDEKNSIYEYTLSTAFDVSTAVFADSTFSVTAQETSPTGMAFSSDGTKMFVVGINGIKVNEYTLSAPFDISTPIFVGNFSVSFQDTNPEDLAFSSDGAKMFIVGNAGNDISEYALSSVYPITVTADAAPDGTPPTLRLTGSVSTTITVGDTYNDAGATCTDTVDGAITPTSSGTVDASQAGTYTLTYSCQDAAGNDATQVEREVIVDAALAPDGTPPTLSLTGSASPTITVGASYTDAGATCEDAVDGAITPTSSGTVDASQAGTYTVTYSCRDAAGNDATPVEREVIVEAAPVSDTTPPTLALIGPDPETITVGASYTDAGATCTDTVDGAITPTSSGTVDASQAGTYTLTYSCQDAAGNDATPAEREVIVEAAPVSDTTPPTLALIGPDPETITVGASYTDAGATCTDTVDGAITPTSSGTVDASQAGTYTVTYSCQDAAGNSAPDVSRDVIVSAAVTNTGQNPPTFVSSTLNNATGVLAITFSEDIDATSVVPDRIHIRESGSYTGGVTLSAGELATTVDGTVISFTLTAQHLAAVKELTVPELTIEPGAVKDTSGDLIVGTFDVSTAVFADSTFSVSTRDSDPRGMAFSSDGTKMFVVDYDSASVNEYTLSAPFDISAPVIAGDFSVSTQDSSPTDVALSNDGTKMFVVGQDSEKIYEYALSAPFDLSTATFANDTSVSPDFYPDGMAFSNDGTKMFVVGYYSNAKINEYALTTAFDISTATFTDTVFSVSSQETFPSGMAFSNDGTKMFVVGIGGIKVNEYTLSAPFDISTPIFADNFSVSFQDTYPEDLAFSNDGAKMFVVGYDNEKIYEYTLSSVYPITVTVSVASDTAPPTLSLTGSASTTITVGASYTDAGATCGDAVDGTIPPTSSGTVDASHAGTYTLTYSCRDAAGNSAPDVSRTVIVSA